jgi:isopentenyl phosphate kinase
MPEEFVLIKFGGSLITDKANICVPNFKNIEKLCLMVSEIIELGKKIIIVHGAGSYGHIKAEKWNLNSGIDYDNQINQLNAVQIVRDDMEELNKIIISELNKNSIDAITYKPHENGLGLGTEYKFSTFFDKILDLKKVPVTYGDVVNTNCEKKFGILSGDDICEILSKKYKISHVIFAIAGADGIIDNPNLPNGGNIIKEYKLGGDVITKNVSNDVTGGMELKIKRASNCLSSQTRVSIINGESPNMIINAILGKEFLGTELIL